MVELLIACEFDEYQVQWWDVTNQERTLNEEKTYHASDYEDALLTMLAMMRLSNIFIDVRKTIVFNQLNLDKDILNDVMSRLEWDDNHREIFRDFVVRFLESHTNDHEAALWGIDEKTWEKLLRVHKLTLTKCTLIQINSHAQ